LLKTLFSSSLFSYHLYRKPNQGQGNKLAEYAKHHIFRVVIKARHVRAPVQIRIQTQNDFCCFPCV